MNIYLLQQHDATGYDTYDSCVVLAETEEEAKRIHPASYKKFGEDRRDWTDREDRVSVIFLGEYSGTDISHHIICSSFNAG